MECLTDLVGVWDQCSDKVAGTKYINDLPGFNLSMADYLSDEERQTGLEVIENCITKAADELEVELRTYLDGRMRLNSVIGNQQVGFFDEDRRVKAAEVGNNGGVQLEIGSGHYLAIYLKDATIFTPNNYTDEPLYIFDLNQGILLDTITFNATAGEYATVPINKTYKSNGQFLNLFVCKAADASYKTDTIPGGCGTCGRSKYLMDGYAYARGAKTTELTNPTDNSLTSMSHTFGVSVNYQLICDSSNFICQLASRLKMAMFYKSGIMWCDEIIFGKRLNSLTTVQKADANALKEEYVLKYEVAMESVLSNMALPDDICFQCDPTITVKSSIP